MKNGPRTLREYFRRSGTTQSDLARRLGLTRGGLNRIVHGKRNPSLRLALAISAATGLPVEKLLSR